MCVVIERMRAYTDKFRRRISVHFSDKDDEYDDYIVIVRCRQCFIVAGLFVLLYIDVADTPSTVFSPQFRSIFRSRVLLF